MVATLFPVGLTCPAAGQIDTGDLSPCVEDGASLCLGDDRFEVQATFTAPGGTPETATAINLLDDTGYFWFFNADNVELIVKVLDACSFADRFWVFAGGLTNVEVEITVRDTASGLGRTYGNPPATPFQPVQDTDAFSTCDVQPAPALIERVTANPEVLPPLQTTRLSCVVRADAPRPVTYRWTADRGLLLGSGAMVTWVAPLNPRPTEITCTAEDADGDTGSASVTVTVVGPAL